MSPSVATESMDEQIQQLGLRQALYRFFAALFLYPDEERIENLSASAAVLFSIEAQWQAYPYADNLQHLLTIVEKLKPAENKSIVDEYNRLFLVKPIAPPYETYYRSGGGQFDGLIAAEVSGNYAEAGLTISPNLNELPDHVAVELEFLSFMCGKELEAIQTEDDSAVEKIQGQQAVFMKEHFARWFPAFAKQAREAAQGELYPAALTAAFFFLRNELAYFEIK